MAIPWRVRWSIVVATDYLRYMSSGIDRMRTRLVNTDDSTVAIASAWRIVALDSASFNTLATGLLFYTVFLGTFFFSASVHTAFVFATLLLTAYFRAIP